MLVTAIIPFHEPRKFLSNFGIWRDKLEKVEDRFQLVLVWDRKNNVDFDVNELKAAFSEITNLNFVEGNFGGPGLARNAGLREALGEWVVFWDSDDVPEPEKTLECISVSKEERVDFIVTQFEVIRGDIPNGSSVSEEVQERKLNGSWYAQGLGIWRIIFKRKAIGSIQFPDIRMGEDLIFFIRVFRFECKYIFLNKTTYYYRIDSEGQLTGNRSLILEEAPKAFFMVDQELAIESFDEDPREIVGLYVRLFITGYFRSESPLSKRILLSFMHRWKSASIKGKFRSIEEIVLFLFYKLLNVRSKVVSST